MSKIELSPLPSGFATTAALNARLDQIENEFNNDVLYRNNPVGEPNAMANTLDMAGNRIINLPDAVADHEPITYRQFNDDLEAAIQEEVYEQLSEAMLAVGTGNVVGPVSSVDNQLAVFNGPTGRLLKTGLLVTDVEDAIDDLDALETDTNAFISQYNLEQYWKTSEDLSGIIQTHGKKVVITGDSLSYNNYGFGFPYVGTAQEAYPGIRSWGFMLRDAIHMNDPCFVYGDNIPWHINNTSYAASAANSTNAFTLPFNNRSMRFVVSNSAAEITLTIASFSIVNKQVVLHMAHSPGQPGKFDVYYNDNNGGADVFVQAVTVGNGVDHQGYAPFTVTIPVNALDSNVRVVLKNFRQTNDSPLASPMALFVLAAGSKLTNVYTTGVGGSTSDFFVTNYASKIGVYAPDILIECTGANDRLTKTLASHLSALGSIFASARASNPAVRIIHITAPPADAAFGNTGYYPDSAISPADTMTMREWVSAVEAFCRQQNVMFFNLYRLLYDIPSAEAFVDGIHSARLWGRNIFKALWSKIFSSAIAPIDHLDGSSTYSTAGTGDLMGRTIGYHQKTPATVKLRGQFKITYVHGTTSWTFSENQEDGTFKPSAFKSIAIIGNAHSNNIEFYCPVVSTTYNEFPEPLKASAEYLSGSGALITGLSISPFNNNILRFTIRDSTGALIDPSTMDGATFLIKYWQ